MITDERTKPAMLRVPFISEYGEDEVSVALDRRCKACADQADPACPLCGGKGWVLTPSGRAVLAFMARHGGDAA